MTSFWLADNLVLLGRHDEARAVFERAGDDDGGLSQITGKRAHQIFAYLGSVLTSARMRSTAGHWRGSRD